MQRVCDAGVHQLAASRGQAAAAWHLPLHGSRDVAAPCAARPRPNPATLPRPCSYPAKKNEVIIHDGWTPWHDDWMRQAKFCLAPYGHGWGIRLSQVMAMGCVPVVVQVGWLLGVPCSAAERAAVAEVHAASPVVAHVCAFCDLPPEPSRSDPRNTSTHPHTHTPTHQLTHPPPLNPPHPPLAGPHIPAVRGPAALPGV
jgi:hypothetical protein